jgi:hypothetical protein
VVAGNGLVQFNETPVCLETLQMNQQTYIYVQMKTILVTTGIILSNMNTFGCNRENTKLKAKNRNTI